MQSVFIDGDGRARFKENPIVRFLLDAGPFDLNQLYSLPGITREDMSQFSQLLGYTVDGYSELSFATDVDEAEAQAQQLLDSPR